MKVILTASEVMQRGNWEKFCELFGLDLWCLNEGKCYSDQEFTLTEQQAREFGILPDEDDGR